MIRLAIAVLVLTFSLGCQGIAKTGAAKKPFEPMSIGAAEEVQDVCARTLGVTCTLFESQMTITIDQTGTPEETQRGVSFMSQYYCRLMRIEGRGENGVLLVRPDGGQVGRECADIGQE
jgi:hypothetical protein